MKRWIGLGLVIALVAPLAPLRAQEPAAPSWCVSAWYPSSEHPGGYETLMAYGDVIDEVNPFWYAAHADGSLLRLAGAEDESKLAAWQAAGMLVLPTIAHASPFAVSDPAARTRHIVAIVQLVESLDYAGIDLDYEGFPLTTRDDFSAFVEVLAGELHVRGRLLSVTVHPKTSDLPEWPAAAAQDWARLAPAADIFRIMTYDFTSRASDQPGPIGPPEWAAEVLAYAATIAPLDKVRLGVHFYGYLWERRRVSTVTWESAQRAADSFGLSFDRDPVDQEARLDVAVRGLPKQTIIVADAVGLAYKLDLILAAYPDLGGVAIWGLGGEDPGVWEVLRTMRPGECAR